jgi:hypothetical protein
VYIRAVDNVGNPTASGSYKASSTLIWDDTPPSVSTVVYDSVTDADGGSATHTNGEVTVDTSGTATDTGGSGIQKVQYSVDQSTWTDFTIGTNFNATMTSTNRTVYIRAVDNVGNPTASGSYKASSTLIWDDTPPSVSTVVYDSVTDADGGSATHTNGEVTVDTSGTATDTGGSGIQKVQYSVDQSTWTDFTIGTNFNATMTSTNRTVYIRAVDNVGNPTASGSYKASSTLIWDDTPPSVSTVVYDSVTDADGGSATHTNGEVTVDTSGTATDTGGSGIQKVQYSVDQSTWTDFTIGTNFNATMTSTNRTVYIRAVDNVGNPTASGSYKASNTLTWDDTPPTFYTSGTFTASYTDTTLTLSSIQMDADASSFTTIKYLVDRCHRLERHCLFR